MKTPSREAIRPTAPRDIGRVLYGRLARQAGPIVVALLRALLARLPARGASGRRPMAVRILPGLDDRPAPMPPVRPPTATNDNPLASIREAVERELRASGHLR